MEFLNNVTILAKVSYQPVSNKELVGKSIRSLDSMNGKLTKRKVDVSFLRNDLHGKIQQRKF